MMMTTHTHVIRSLECLDVPSFLEQLDRTRVAWTDETLAAMGGDTYKVGTTGESRDKIGLQMNCCMNIRLRLTALAAHTTRDDGFPNSNSNLGPVKNTRVSLRHLMSRRKSLPVLCMDFNVDETQGVINRISDIVDCTVAEGYL